MCSSKRSSSPLHLFDRVAVLIVCLLISIYRVNYCACDDHHTTSGGGGGSGSVALRLACTSSLSSSLPFCDLELAVDERVRDVVGRLTLPEKVAQLVNSAPGVPRLGIPPYEWWSEALHGVSNVGPGTTFTKTFITSTYNDTNSLIRSAVSFPQVILTAASFNTCLWKAIGQVVSTEARAMYNEAQSGLTFWSPNINIYRDPRWGRGQETPGEDPYLASQYAIYYVRGLQDTSSSNNNLKVAACCKHYTAYDLDSWNGIDRFHFDAKVSQQDLDDTYQPPFKSCVQEGNAACVMCSYNRVNGVPTCVDKGLLGGTVRDKWGLNGYIASDCDSVDVLYNTLHYTQSPEDAATASIQAGLNMNCGSFLAKHTIQAVAQGKLNESEVDGSLSYLYTVLMRLGYFNGDPALQEFGSLGSSDVCTSDHTELAIEAARQGIVLLKNDKDILPLSQTSIQNLAVIGPNANVTSTMIGNYAGVPCKYITPLQGLAEYAQNISYEVGCENVACGSDIMVGAAVRAAEVADAVVLVMGLDQSQEREGLDRTMLTLPGQQESLITQVASSAKGPVVLVIMSGGPVDVGFAKQNPCICGIIWVGYPGQGGGQAIAEVIFGDHNPAGKLPVSWYPQSYTQIPMTDMRMRPDPSTGYPGRTYRFYTGDTLYTFGDGLSYTKFSHLLTGTRTHMTNLSLNHSANHTSSNYERLIPVDTLQCNDLNFDLLVDVSNVGSVTGSHVVLVFWHPPTWPGAPTRQLVAFQRVQDLQPGHVTQLQVRLNACQHLSFSNHMGAHMVPTGFHTLAVGESLHTLTLS